MGHLHSCLNVVKFCINSGINCVERGNGRLADEVLHAGKFGQRNWKSLPIWRRVQPIRYNRIGLRKCGFGHRRSCLGGLQRHCICLRTNRLRKIVHHARIYRTSIGTFVWSDFYCQFRNKVFLFISFILEIYCIYIFIPNIYEHMWRYIWLFDLLVFT